MTQVNSEDKAVYNANTSIEEDDKAIANALRILQKRLVQTSFEMTSPDSVKEYLTLKLADIEHETFNVLYLNNQNKLIAFKEEFKGTIDSCSVFPREIVKSALACNANAVIFAHNHPSGMCEPSQADKNITAKLSDALNMIDIRTLDHLIVAGINTYSFAENGLI